MDNLTLIRISKIPKHSIQASKRIRVGTITLDQDQTLDTSKGKLVLGLKCQDLSFSTPKAENQDQADTKFFTGSADLVPYSSLNQDLSELDRTNASSSQELDVERTGMPRTTISPKGNQKPSTKTKTNPEQGRDNQNQVKDELISGGAELEGLAAIFGNIHLN